MGYIYVDPAAAGDANFIHSDGKCYSRVGERYVDPIFFSRGLPGRLGGHEQIGTFGAAQMG
jgi:hypothetical protein